MLMPAPSALNLETLPDPFQGLTSSPLSSEGSPASFYLDSPEERSRAKEVLKNKYGRQRWRLDNLYWIVNEKGYEIQFQLNLVQKILYYTLWFFNCILKSRQHGITTFFCILFLDVCLFNSNVHACIIAHNREDAEEFFERNIKHAYYRLDPVMRQLVRATQDSKRKLSFSNGSSIRVTTSGRSGTYQLVHISEYGKISAKYPEKAREIKTGTLNAVHPGQLVTIESTAEGREGQFYDICTMSQKLAKSVKAGTHELSIMEPKFLFFPWYMNPLNVVDPTGVVLLEYQREYLEKIEAKLQIKLRPEQKAWYVLKWNVMGDDMKREHPSTPEEAFYAAVVGTFYGKEMASAREQGRITIVPAQKGILVDTWWDIGIGDETSIWFTQDVGREIHVIDYYENSGEGFSHYKQTLDEKAKKRGYIYGVHGAPHDMKDREWITGKSRWKAAAEVGLTFKVAPRLTVESGIEQVRRILAVSVFDEPHCERGITALEHYRKEWNEQLQTYRKTPLHDWASHGADAFRTLAVLHKFRGILAATGQSPSPNVAAMPATPAIGITQQQALKDPEAWT